MRLRRLPIAILFVMVAISCGNQSESESGSKVDPGSAIVLDGAKPPYEIRGEFTLKEGSGKMGVPGCSGTGGYDDIEYGLSVTVRDGSGHVLGTGRLGEGKLVGSYLPKSCIFEFSVGGLPEVKFYAVEVGRRGELIYSFEEMRATNWRVAFSLG